MKTPSDELFKLIKSMNAQEKVHFKKYAARKKSDNYSIALFNAVNTTGSFNETEIRSKLKNKNLLKNFNRFKNYTYEILLKSISDYYSGSTIDSNIRNLLHYAEVLRQKKLFNTEKKILFKAEKIALEHERFEYLAIILSNKRALFIGEEDHGNLENYLKKDAKIEIACIDHLKKIAELKNLSNQITLIRYKYLNVRDTKYLDQVKVILQSPQLLTLDNVKSYDVIKLFYTTNTIGNVLLGEWQTAYTFIRKFNDYLESDKKKLLFQIEDYFITLANSLLILVNLKELKKCEDIYNKAISVYASLSSKKKHKITSHYFMRVLMNYMGLMNLRGFPDKSLAVWEKLKGIVSQKFIQKEFNVTYYSNLFLSNFVLNNFHEALKWINVILNYKGMNRLDTQSSARVYLLMIHYELGNQELLPYLAKGSEKDLKKMDAFNPFTKTIINFFAHKAPNINNKKDEKVAFKNFKHDILKTLEDMPKSISSNFYEDELSTWIDSKIKNKSCVEIMRERF